MALTHGKGSVNINLVVKTMLWRQIAWVLILAPLLTRTAVFSNFQLVGVGWSGEKRLILH